MTRPKKNIVTIVGTTGVGKSKFSIELAKAINGEIINADSMQVYKGLDSITNKHPFLEREGIPHHVMDHVGWNEEYFIHRFSQEANEAIASIHDRGKVPIIIGGTHYYLQKLLFKNKTVEGAVEEGKRPLTPEQQQVLDGPVEEIFSQLQKFDPVIAQKFHPQDRRKLRRALEIWYTLNQKPSELYKEQKLEELEDSSLIYNTVFFWVFSDAEVLQKRLNDRVDAMLSDAGGGLDEIRQMYEVYKTTTPRPQVTNGVWQVIGFKEFLPWLEQRDQDTGTKALRKLYDDGVERMKIRTRQYAKYQVKWIKKLLGVELQKESRFNFKYGGKLYILNATNLDNWDSEVQARGLEIARQFLERGPTGVDAPQKPDSITEDIFPDEKKLAEFNSNKRLESVKNWQHFVCDHCVDKQGQPVVAVGAEAWAMHEKSRRHRKSVEGRKRRRQGEEYRKESASNTITGSVTRATGTVEATEVKVTDKNPETH